MVNPIETLWNDTWRKQQHPLIQHAISVVRFLFVLGRDLGEGQISLRAMSLVYTTLLSFVPLLALSFSVLKAFGVHNQIEPLLLGFLEPFGTRGTEISAQIILFVENMKVGVLGAVGLALLLYTVISLIQKIESAFNFIWHIKSNRPLSQRFSGYLSVIITAPILIFAAIGLSQSVAEGSMTQQLLGIDSIGWAFVFVGKLLPFIFTALVFAFIYILIPNTRVHAGSAFIAGLITAVLWKTLGWAFATFVLSSGQYDAVYSGFAAAIFFIIWLYLNWLLLLLGGSMTYYLQHPDNKSKQRSENQLSFLAAETACFHILKLMFVRFENSEKPFTLPEIVKASKVPHLHVNAIMLKLIKNGYLSRTEEKRARYIFNQSPNKIMLADIWAMMRGNLLSSQQETTISRQLEEVIQKQLKKKTIADL